MKEWDTNLHKDKELSLRDPKSKNSEINRFQTGWHMLTKNKTKMLKMY